MARSRDVLEAGVRNIQLLRDRHIDNIGQDILVTIVLSQTSDIYGDKESQTTRTYKDRIIPDWNRYQAQRKIAFDLSEEDNVPIEAIAKVESTIPVGSVITIPNGILGLIEDNARYRVTKNIVKAQAAVYERRITMVPDRGSKYA